MLLQTQQVMPPYVYICDVKIVQSLILYGNSLYLLDDPRMSKCHIAGNLISVINLLVQMFRETDYLVPYRIANDQTAIPDGS